MGFEATMSRAAVTRVCTISRQVYNGKTRKMSGKGPSTKAVLVNSQQSTFQRRSFGNVSAMNTNAAAKACLEEHLSNGLSSATTHRYRASGFLIMGLSGTALDLMLYKYRYQQVYLRQEMRILPPFLNSYLLSVHRGFRRSTRSRQQFYGCLSTLCSKIVSGDLHDYRRLEIYATYRYQKPAQKVGHFAWQNVHQTNIHRCMTTK